MFSNFHLPIGLDLTCRMQVRGGNLERQEIHEKLPARARPHHWRSQLTLKYSPYWGRWVALAVTPERAAGMASGVRREGRANTTCRRREWNPFPFKG